MNKEHIINTGINNGRLAAATAEIIFNETMELPMLKEYSEKVKLTWGEQQSIAILIEQAVEYFVSLANEFSLVQNSPEAIATNADKNDWNDITQMRMEIFLDRTYIGILTVLFPEQIRETKDALKRLKKLEGKSSTVTVQDLANKTPHCAEFYEIFLKNHQKMMESAQNAE